MIGIDITGNSHATLEGTKVSLDIVVVLVVVLFLFLFLSLAVDGEDVVLHIHIDFFFLHSRKIGMDFVVLLVLFDIHTTKAKEGVDEGIIIALSDTELVTALVSLATTLLGRLII